MEVKTRWSRRARDFFDLRGAGTQFLVAILVVLIVGGGALWLDTTRSAISEMLSAEIDVWMVLVGTAVIALLYLALRSASARVSGPAPRQAPHRSEDSTPRERSARADAPVAQVGPPLAARQAKAEPKPVYKWIGGDWAEGEGTLDIKSSQLESFYERARSDLQQRGISGRLCFLFISVYPFQTPGGQARVFMTFYSDDSQKDYQYLFDEFDQMNADPPRDRGRASNCWDQPPWHRQPGWASMIRKSSLVVGKLTQNSNTHLYIYPNDPDSDVWTVSWSDEAARRDYLFTGSSAEDLERLT